MLIIKRLLTAAGCLIPTVFIIFFTLSCIGGAVVGAIAGGKLENQDDSYEAGKFAGEQFGEQYLIWILIGSVVLSAIISLIVTFSGLLPWCRKPVDPQDLKNPSPPAEQ